MNLENYYWYFEKAIPERICDDIIKFGLQQNKEKAIIGDAMVTREKNIALAIMTADCLPILLISNRGDEIAAIHGGWRPLSANIITNTIKYF